MGNKYTPSVNIVRDAHKEMEYIVTPNAEKSATKIFNEFNKGLHCFTIIGSYGTGKSSFLWALEQTLSGNKLFDADLIDKSTKLEIVNIVGSYNSMLEVFNEQFDVKGDYSNSQKLFDAVFQKYESLGTNGLMVIAIDEFGKFLEYAANNEPEKEMYFIQQLAEFVNAPDRNILLLTTLHQGLDSYASKLSDSQKNEWRKVKGRLKEITFNEPVEQLLSLAANHFESSTKQKKDSSYSKAMSKLQKKKNIFRISKSYVDSVGDSLYPMDLFSAYVLTMGLQRYGQNERSLFSFLASSKELGLFDYNDPQKTFSIASVYDYLFESYYQTLSSSGTLDASGWRAIRETLQRVETIETGNNVLAENIVKTIGLLQIFASKGAKTDDEFLETYFSNCSTKKEFKETLDVLTKHQIIRYFKFDFSYKLFEGTDLDIEGALLKAENQISDVPNLVGKLNTHFEFPIVSAKEHSYRTGTPRLFEYRLSDQPINEIPEGEIDGFINLIFSPRSFEDVKDKVKNSKNAIIYGYFNNTEKIASVLYEIEKTEQVLKNIKGEDDKVAEKALHSIVKGNELLLNHYVLDALYNDDVSWIKNGEEVKIKSKRELNRTLSELCDEVYPLTPVLKNELFNKHKVSGVIAGARKNYFEALTTKFNEKYLGFPEDKFPPEKTIYYTLLNRSGIHVKTKSGYTLTAPNSDSSIYQLWEACEAFLATAVEERKKLTDLYKILSSAPYKIKQGVIDFWVPTFLFIRKGDYALYSKGNFKPYINDAALYLTTRVPQDYELKSFALNDLRVSFFNRYREFLMQDEKQKLNVDSFIESIRPILLTYKGLTPYEQKTKRISKEAVELREAIRNTQDPEKVFFDEFPKALGFNVNDLLKSEENFDDYIYKFQNTLEEIKNGYAELLNRIENYITAEIVGRKCDFSVYKKELIKRFASIKEHQLLAKQKTFIQRVNSPLNDRDSWLASIGQVLTGKSLSSIDDNDEIILKENLSHLVTELDNFSQLDKLKFDEKKEEVFKLDFTTQKDGLNSNMIRISKDKLEKAQDSIKAIGKELGKDKKMRIAILAKLLKDELDNG